MKEKMIVFLRKDRLIDRSQMRLVAYPLSGDVVLRQQRLFCEGLVAEKRLERSRHQTISTALFVLAYPGSRTGKCQVNSLAVVYLGDAIP